jgi:hypothetical protein
LFNMSYLRCDIGRAMGSSAWTPWRRPRNMDCAGDFTMRDVVVVVSLFGHVHGVERMVGDPTVHIASSLAAPRSRFEGLTRGQWAAEFLGAVQGFFRAKAQRISANDSDACWCRKPLRDVIVVILLTLWLRVKPLTSWSQQRRRCTSLHSQGHRRGALVPLDIVPMSSVASFRFFVFLFFKSLICFVRGSPLPPISDYRFGHCGFIYKVE